MNGVEHPHDPACARQLAETTPAESSSRRSLGFPHSARLLKHADFDRVYQQGRRLFSIHMTFFFRRRGEAQPVPKPGCATAAARDAAVPGPRVGFTVSRALGGAVQRNRLKRRLREAVRLKLAALTAPVDVVINPKRTAGSAEFAQLAGEVERAFGQIQLRLASAAPGTEAAVQKPERRGKAR